MIYNRTQMVRKISNVDLQERRRSLSFPQDLEYAKCSCNFFSLIITFFLNKQSIYEKLRIKYKLLSHTIQMNNQ